MTAPTTTTTKSASAIREFIANPPRNCNARDGIGIADQILTQSADPLLLERQMSVHRPGDTPRSHRLKTFCKIENVDAEDPRTSTQLKKRNGPARSGRDASPSPTNGRGLSDLAG
jgi:hypothetical protein